MKVTVLTGPQGSGKSTVMRKDAIAQPGLYLFAFPTHECSASAPLAQIWGCG